MRKNHARDVADQARKIGYLDSSGLIGGVLHALTYGIAKLAILHPRIYNDLHRRPSTPQLQNISSPLSALKSSLDGEQLSVLRYVRRRALSGRPSTYLVGGPVRDVLLGRPVADMDFVVEGDAPQLARDMAAELGGQVVVHARFGTASVALEGMRVDVVTARSETYTRPAALPEVTAGSIANDLHRRDFSINALALPLNDSRPQVLDLHGGIEDMSSGLIRSLHPNSFVDDPTRIFRAVRYQGRLGFCMEQETLAQLQSAVAQGHIASLTPDRVRHELERILQEDQPSRHLQQLSALEVLAAIHPSLAAPQVEAHLAAVAAPDSGREDRPDPLVYLSALAYSLSTAQAESVIYRLNMPAQWAQVVRDTVQVRALESTLAGPSLAPADLARLLDGFSAEALWAVSRLADSPTAIQRVGDYLNKLRGAAPALDGSDLLAMGVPQGPLVGRLLRELRDAKLDGRVSTKRQERRLVQAALTREGSPTGHG